MGLKVLSLFDGMSCGQLALERLGIEVDTYYASEIDKYAMQVTQANFPNTIHIGDVCNIKAEDYQDIDLILAGSPCQGFSFAGKQLAFDDPRSALFFEFVRLLKEIKPKYFLLENVKMKQQFQDVITEQVSACYPDLPGDMFGSKIEPILINSALLSAQNRQRLYWTNIPNIEQPEDKGIVLKNVLENDAEEPMYSNIYGGFGEKKPREHYRKSITIRANSRGGSIPNVKIKDFDKNLDKMTTKEGKAYALTASYNGAVAWNSIEKKQRSMVPVTKKEVVEEKRIVVDKEKRQLLIAEATKKGYTVIEDGDCFDINFPNSKTRRGRNMKYKCNALTTASQNFMRFENLSWRKLTPLECERLQTVPDNYTNHVSNTQRYKMLGNGWTVEVIAHILNNMEL